MAYSLVAYAKVSSNHLFCVLSEIYLHVDSELSVLNPTDPTKLSRVKVKRTSKEELSSENGKRIGSFILFPIYAENGHSTIAFLNHYHTKFP